MNSPRHIAIVFYPQAGKGKAAKVAQQLHMELLNRGVHHTVFSEKWPPVFTNFTDVFLVGGDGTLNFFINRYPNISIPISIFKGGSGNDFAWKLLGNKDFAQQLQTALTAIAQPIDAGICNGYYFINGAGIGFDGEVVRAMGKKRMIAASHMAYLWTVLKKIFSYREKALKLSFDGQVTQDKFFLLSIANGSRYGGGFKVAPQAVVNDGWLDLVQIRSIHPLKRIFHLPKVEKGKHLKLSFVSSHKIKKITIHAAEKVAAHLDGELMISDYFDIEILPGKFFFRY